MKKEAQEELPQRLINELEEELGPRAEATGGQESLATGSGTLLPATVPSPQRARLEDAEADFVSVGVAVGDIVLLGPIGAVVDGVEDTALEMEFFDTPPILNLEYEYEAVGERFTLTSTVTDETSYLRILSGAAEEVGLEIGEFVPDDFGFEVVGTLAGETRSTTQDKALLGIPDASTPLFETSLLQSNGFLAYEALRSSLRRLLRHDTYAFIDGFSSVSEKALSAAQLSQLKSRALNDSIRQLAAVLFLLDGETPGRSAVLQVLQRLGVQGHPEPPVSLLSALEAYNPELDEEIESIGAAAIDSFESRGYDRAASLLVEGRYGELSALTGEEASRAGRMTRAMRQVGARLQDNRALQQRRIATTFRP